MAEKTGEERMHSLLSKIANEMFGKGAVDADVLKVATAALLAVKATTSAVSEFKRALDA